MKSRTSFCNGHVLKKDILRFTPLWAVYVIFLAVYTFDNISYKLTQETVKLAYSLAGDMGELYWLPLLFGFGCATFLFGDLFRSRMATGLHAMPLRRETWFGTHVLAGFLFTAVPNGLIAVFMALCLGEYAFVAGLWWLALTGQFLFHFALGVLCVMLSGNLLGHVAAFGTLEFFSQLIYGIYDAVYEPMLYGITTGSETVELFCPSARWAYADYLEWIIQDNMVVAEGVGKYGGESYLYHEPSYIYNGPAWGEWRYLAVCALLAVGFLALAMALYRRRKLEWAGDFLTSGVIRWALLILGSMYIAIVLPVAGFVVGFFGILMLSERRLKVFYKKNLIAFGVTAAAVLLTLGLTWLDPLGITARVPSQAETRQVTLNPDWGRGSLELTDPADIQTVIGAHEYALAHRDLEEGDWYSLQLEYTLQDGSAMRRSYQLNADAPALEGVRKILSRWEFLFDGLTPLEVEQSLYGATFYQEEYDENGLYINSREITVPQEELGGLLDAVYRDCQEGRMAQNAAFHEEGSISLTFWYEEGERLSTRQSLSVYADSRHTMAFLETYMQ